jgi:hypothetical protein
MIIYVTTAEMLDNDKVKEVLTSESKKERKLILFYQKDFVVSFETLETLLPAARKILIVPKMCNSPNEMLIQMGMFFASVKSSDTVYTIFGTDQYDEALRSYNILPYEGKPAKRTPRKRISESSDTGIPAKQATANGNVKTEPVNGKIKDDFLNPPESASEKTIHHPSIPDNPTDRKLFLSILELDAKSAGFAGTDDEFILAIGDCMQNVEVEGANLQNEIYKKFEEPVAGTVYENVSKKYVYLQNSLTCNKG